MFGRRRVAIEGSSPRTSPGWVPSPGGWTAPEGERAGRDWVPPGGAGERLDRMPWWVRVWAKPPFRGLGDFDSWLWDHGGYDVEGPEATARREREQARWQVEHEAFEAAAHPALQGEVALPTLSRERTGLVTLLDADRCGDYAVVLAVTDEDMSAWGSPTLRTQAYRRTNGEWEQMGGGGSGGDDDPLFARANRPFEDALQLEGVSGSGLDVRRRSRRRWLKSARVLCAPHVARVEIVTAERTREADVSAGPGWLVVAWTSDLPTPTLTAFDRAGHQVGVLSPSRPDW